MIEAKDILKIKKNGEWVDLLAVQGSKGEKGDKGDAYVITEADKHQIADEVEGKYTAELGEIKQD